MIIELTIPLYSTFTGKSLAINVWNDPQLILGTAGLTIFLGIAAGLYPAFILSSFRPVNALKTATQGRGDHRAHLRKVLVVVQFTISIFMIIGTGVVIDQLHFLRNKNLGFDKEQVLVVPVRNTPVLSHLDAFKDALLTNPGVLNASAASHIIGQDADNRWYRPEGTPPDEWMILTSIFTDLEFFNTMNIDILAGRSFSPDFSSDTLAAYVINESAVSHFGWRTPQEALGKSFEFWKRPGQGVGVMKDFHYISLHDNVQPLVIHYYPEGFRYLMVRIHPDNSAETIAHLEQTWQQFSPERPLAFSFLDENLNLHYQGEEKLSRIFSIFSLLAIFIACLGLFWFGSVFCGQPHS